MSTLRGSHLSFARVVVGCPYHKGCEERERKELGYCEDDDGYKHTVVCVCLFAIVMGSVRFLQHCDSAGSDYNGNEEQEVEERLAHCLNAILAAESPLLHAAARDNKLREGVIEHLAHA